MASKLLVSAETGPVPTPCNNCSWPSLLARPSAGGGSLVPAPVGIGGAGSRALARGCCWIRCCDIEFHLLPPLWPRIASAAVAQGPVPGARAPENGSCSFDLSLALYEKETVSVLSGPHTVKQSKPQPCPCL